MTKKMIKQLGRIFFSVGAPLLFLGIWWKAFDGDYTRTDLFWHVIVTVSFAVATYLYFPISKKVERFSVIWWAGLFAAFFLVSYGSVKMGFWTDISPEFFPAADRAWGEYMVYLGFWIPAVHITAIEWNKPYNWSLLKRRRPIEDADDVHA